MAEGNSSSSSGGIGFVGLLTIAFIVLKLCGVIHWSWLWVVSPIWISVGLFVAVLLIVGAVWLAVKTIKHYRTRNRRAKFKNVA